MASPGVVGVVGSDGAVLVDDGDHASPDVLDGLGGVAVLEGRERLAAMPDSECGVGIVVGVSGGEVVLDVGNPDADLPSLAVIGVGEGEAVVGERCHESVLIGHEGGVSESAGVRCDGEEIPGVGVVAVGDGLAGGKRLGDLLTGLLGVLLLQDGVVPFLVPEAALGPGAVALLVVLVAVDGAEGGILLGILSGLGEVSVLVVLGVLAHALGVAGEDLPAEGVVEVEGELLLAVPGGHLDAGRPVVLVVQAAGDALVGVDPDGPVLIVGVEASLRHGEAEVHAVGVDLRETDIVGELDLRDVLPVVGTEGDGDACLLGLVVGDLEGLSGLVAVLSDELHLNVDGEEGLGKESNLDNVAFSCKEKKDLLRFANILSLSSRLIESGKHMVWTQQIVAILSVIFPKDDLVTNMRDKVLLNCTNYYGLKKTPSEIRNFDLMDRIFQESKYASLEMPFSNGDHFYESQKIIYDGICKEALSYSAPTSMGKSFLMRLFMIDRIKHGFRGNFAFIVPTKALINELDRKVMEKLEPYVKEKDYRIVKTPNDLVLEGKHSFVFIMTPERFFHLLIMKPEVNVDYVFIDEAHNISRNEGRTAFYYKITSILLQKNPKPHFVFASPNIPNPGEYLRLTHTIGDGIRTCYSPVSQIKFILNLVTGKDYVYNDYAKSTIELENQRTDSFIDIVEKIGNQKFSSDKNHVQNLIYCNSVYNAINYAKEFGSRCNDLNDPILDKLSKDISEQIHPDYFLVELIKKGIAYHVGYIPPNLRLRIENQFLEGKIRFLFCTSTLMEGVNLPADNLFITSDKSGNLKLDQVAFNNLMGRVGRIDFNLFGNVFLIIPDNKKTSKLESNYLKFLEDDIPNQVISIDKFKKAEVSAINKSIAKGDYSFSDLNPTSDNLDSIRKISLVLLDDIKRRSKTPVVDKFLGIADDETKESILRRAQQMPNIESLDISEDQSSSLEEAILNPDFHYPPHTDADSVYSFLKKLSLLFRWEIYERDNLGMGDSIRHYSYMISAWMEGKGLSQIIASSIYHIAREELFYDRRSHSYFGYNPNNLLQRNLIIAEALYELENVVRFKISNYFREVTEKLKKLYGKDFIANDWYEYIEYGTKNELIIDLEKIGYTRETATYIKSKRESLVMENRPNDLVDFSLSYVDIVKSSNDDLKKETEEIKSNLPELFA